MAFEGSGYADATLFRGAQQLLWLSRERISYDWNRYFLSGAQGRERDHLPLWIHTITVLPGIAGFHRDQQAIAYIDEMGKPKPDYCVLWVFFCIENNLFYSWVFCLL